MAAQHAATTATKASSLSASKDAAPTTTPTSKPEFRFTVASMLSPMVTPASDRLFKLPADNAKSMRQPTSAPDQTMNRLPLNSLSGNSCRPVKELPPSPPVSPHDKARNEDVECAAEENIARDPPLFPNLSSRKTNGAHTTLLPTAADTPPNHGAPISKHTAKPRPLAPTDVCHQNVKLNSVVLVRYKEDPRAWIRDEKKSWCKYGQKRKHVADSSSPAAARAPVGVRKPVTAATRLPRTPRVTKRTPKAAAMDRSAKIRPLNCKPPRPAQSRDDVDFRKIADYAPPLFTLSEDGKRSLKAEWKGQPLDLSADPDRAELHPAELSVASTLRLTCATYLYNKRRIFQARIRALLRREDFNKTKAQQACKIDVNKASKLWAAYDKIGWFKPDLFQHHLATFDDWED